MNINNIAMRFLFYVVAVAVTIRLVWMLLQPVVIPLGILIAVVTTVWIVWRLLTRDRLL